MASTSNGKTRTRVKNDATQSLWQEIILHHCILITRHGVQMVPKDLLFQTLQNIGLSPIGALIFHPTIALRNSESNPTKTVNVASLSFEFFKYLENIMVTVQNVVVSPRIHSFTKLQG